MEINHKKALAELLRDGVFVIEKPDGTVEIDKGRTVTDYVDDINIISSELKRSEKRDEAIEKLRSYIFDEIYRLYAGLNEQYDVVDDGKVETLQLVLNKMGELGLIGEA